MVAATTAAVLGAAAAATAQPGPSPRPRQAAAMDVVQATTLTQGWAFLAQGDLERAAEKASEAVSARPRSAAAFALSLEVAIARGGALAGLDTYRDWIGARSEAPTLLRRIAEAVLQEIAAGADPSAQLSALEALYEAGEPAAASRLLTAVQQGSITEARALAARGDPLAVRQLSAALGGTIANAVGAIQALGASRSPAAVPALLGRLDDRRSEVRGAAAEALGRTGGLEVADRLRPLLDDPSGHVRFKAAGALLALGDFTGLPLLEQLKSSESAQTRLGVAEAMESRPDQDWESLVRDLTEAPEPEVRLRAAALAGRFDPALAQQTLQGLTGHPNGAISQEAARVLAADGDLDLNGLRALLRHPDGLTRVAAAGSILRLTQ